MKLVNLGIITVALCACFSVSAWAATASASTVNNQSYTLRLDATENPQISSTIKKSIAASCNDNSQTVPLASKAASDGTQKLYCAKSGKPVINTQTQMQVKTTDVLIESDCGSNPLCPD